MTAAVRPAAYWAFVSLAAVGCAFGCAYGRAHPGPWRVTVARVVGAVLALDAVSWIVALAVHGTFSYATSLPLALCNMAVLVAAAACWWRVPLLVELTYFWGLAGSLQAVLTPDLNVDFPHLVFFQYVVGHLGIVAAALFLVVGMGMAPRRGAVARTIAITCGYTALVGLVDALTGANYMFLRHPPGNATLLTVLGPWPWYVLSAAGVGVVLVMALDMPFRAGRGPAGTHGAATAPRLETSEDVAARSQDVAAPSEDVAAQSRGGV